VEGKGVVFLYRPASGYGGWSCPKHRVSEGEYLALPQGSYLRFDVPPGRRRVETQTSWCFRPPLSLVLNIYPGDIVYVRYTFSPSPKPGFDPPQLRDEPWLGFEVVPRDTALKEMKSCELEKYLFTAQCR
jgi:hypothetical protein